MHMHTDTCMHDTAAALRSLNTAALYISEGSGIFYLASRQIHHAHLRVFVASYQQISPFSAAAVYKTAWKTDSTVQPSAGFLSICQNQIQGLFKNIQGPYEGYIKRTKLNQTSTFTSIYTVSQQKTRTLVTLSNISNKSGPILIIFGTENRQ